MRTSGPPAAAIVGRHDELRRLDALIAAARSGQGGALVLRGPAGIGKSTLLDHAGAAADGFCTIRAAGAQFETELPFAGLHQLCLPLLGELENLLVAHRDALRGAFGLAEGPPDLFRVGLAALSLLARAAQDRPLLCVVDDAQWLDSASVGALAFVSRRLACEPIAVLLGARTPGPPSVLDELPGLGVAGIGDADARTLLAVGTHLTLDEQIRDCLIAEARGNPLALLELPRAGGFAPPEGTSVQSRVEYGFADRLVGLPDAARLLLLVASADPTGDPGLLWPAARLLNIDLSAAGAASGTGLVEFSTRVRFCHPLARSAVYLAADAGDRRTAHRVLAEATDPMTDPDRRAWHRAQACAGPDDEVAADLERSALRAQVRGGVAASAAFLERAAALSLDPADRNGRTLRAVRALLDAGCTDAAADLLATAENALLDEHGHALLDQLRGRIAFVRPGDDNGPRFMLRAARRLAVRDPVGSRECLLEALEMSLLVGRATGMMEQVLTAAPPGHPPDVLDALRLLTTEGHDAAAPLLHEVLHNSQLWTKRPAVAVMLAAELWDPDTYAAIVEWLMKTGRESGSPLTLRLGLALGATHAVLAGDLGSAIAATAEEEALADATGGPPVFYHRLHLAAMRGDPQEAHQLFETATAAANEAGHLIANVHWSAAMLNNGLADYPAALAAARQAVAQGGLSMAGFALPELVEAAVRCGEPVTAAEALDLLTARTAAAGTTTGLGVAAYARGLVTGVEEHFREAVDRLANSPLLAYRARAHLLYGEWLRRQGRRRASLAHLRSAHDLLSGAGMKAYARRAAVELRATGETARRRHGPAHEQLTMQELTIARIVATGATSNEVASRLFISPRTVDAHLRNVFRKLGVTSRRQLRGRPDLGDPSG